MHGTDLLVTDWKDFGPALEQLRRNSVERGLRGGTIQLRGKLVVASHTVDFKDYFGEWTRDHSMKESVHFVGPAEVGSCHAPIATYNISHDHIGCVWSEGEACTSSGHRKESRRPRCSSGHFAI
jgi:hypothetical protein